MKIVDRTAFLAMPAGVVYAKVETPPTYDFGSLCIKGDTSSTDWYEQRLVGDFVGTNDSGEWVEAIDQLHAGGSRDVDFDIVGRDGLFDDDQLFAVFERADVERLIERLSVALADGYSAP